MESREGTSGLSTDDQRLAGAGEGSGAGVGGVSGEPGGAPGDPGRAIAGDADHPAPVLVPDGGDTWAPRRRGRKQRPEAEARPSEGCINVEAVEAVVRRILAISAAARDIRRLTAKAEALKAMGLSSAEAAARRELHAIEEDRHVLLGLCEAVQEAVAHDGETVFGVLSRLDPSGALHALLTKRS